MASGAAVRRTGLCMKLTHPIAVKFSSLILSAWLRLWHMTMDVGFVMESSESDPVLATRRNLYLFWHEMILFPAYTHARYRVATLVSQHRDGELIAQVMRMLRGQAIRGSTTRGAVPALRTMMRRAKMQHLAITPDGPKGPRRTVQMGAIFLASRSGMPLIPLGFAYSDCWRNRSWDKTAIPKPFAVARSVVGRPILVPPDVDRSRMEDYRLLVQREMDRVQAQAEALAAGRAASPSVIPYSCLGWERDGNAVRQGLGPLSADQDSAGSPLET